MALLLGTAGRPVSGLRKVTFSEGSFVTTTAGAIESSDCPPGVSVAKTGTGEYTITFPIVSGGSLFTQMKCAAGANVRLHVSSTGQTTAVLKTEVLSVEATIAVDEGPPVTATTTPVVTWTATNTADLMIFFALAFRE